MSGETKQRISDLETEVAIARQRVTDLVNENRHLRECHPNMRDQFAMAALTGIIARSATYFDSQSFNLFASYSYEIADAMMEARDAKG